MRKKDLKVGDLIKIGKRTALIINLRGWWLNDKFIDVKFKGDSSTTLIEVADVKLVTKRANIKDWWKHL